MTLTILCNVGKGGHAQINSILHTITRELFITLKYEF